MDRKNKIRLFSASLTYFFVVSREHRAYVHFAIASFSSAQQILSVEINKSQWGNDLIGLIGI